MRRTIILFSTYCAFVCGNASAVVVTTYSDVNAFQNALASLGLGATLIDFETRTNGTPVPAGAQPAASPLNYSLVNGQNTATFSTGSQFVYESFASHSPSHSLRETSSGPIFLDYSHPVAAVGAFALDIDTLTTDAATAIYHSTVLPDVVQLFDNTGGHTDNVAFFGAIATDDSLSHPINILTGVTFDQSNTKASEFTYIDDVFTAQIPEPSTLLLLGFGAISLLGCRKRAKRASVCCAI